MTARVVAGVLLAATVLGFAPRPLAAFGPQSHGCPLPSSAATPALAAAADEPCHHAGEQACLVNTACAGTAPAVQSRPVEFSLARVVETLASTPVGTLPDLFRAGPPTPPPNS